MPSIKTFSSIFRILLQKRYFFLLVLSIPLILLLIIQINLIYTYPILYDDAYNISVSKNLADGIGYATSYDKIIFHNPEVTTGPTMVIWGAVLIKFLGNNYWLPGLAAASLFNLLLILIALTLGNKIFKRLIPISLFVSLYLAYLYEINITTGMTAVSFLGELSAALLVIWSFVLLRVRTRWGYSISGLVLTLAFLTKYMSLLALPGVVVAIFFKNRFENGGLKDLIVKYTLFLLPIMLCSLVYLLIRSQAQSGLDSETDFFLSTGSGIKEIMVADNRFYFLMTNLRNNVELLVNFFGGKFRFGWVLLLLTGFPLLDMKYKWISPKDRPGFYGLFIVVMTIGLWWSFFSSGVRLRHVLIAILVFFYWISESVIQFERKKLAVVIVCIFLLLSFLPNSKVVDSTRRPNLVRYINHPNVVSGLLSWDRERRLKSLLETKDIVSNLKNEDQRVVFLGCGWWANRDLEYLMDGHLNFRDCGSILNGMEGESNYYLVRSEYWNWEGNADYETFRLYCEKT